MSERPGPVFGAAVESALRAAARWHHGQSRRGCADLPYFAHVVAVAMVLDRLGYDDDVVIAGLLHDAVEDSGIPLETIAGEFGPRVAELVGWCSERKKDERGAERPWAVRKADYLDALASAPAEARAVALADKLHNLTSIRFDLIQGRDIWSLFHAGRDDVLAYYRGAIARLGTGEARLERLADECRRALAEVENQPVRG
jgi:(p)ppGpp synthase/HD superfamily hydrolase